MTTRIKENTWIQKCKSLEKNFENIIQFIKRIYNTDDFIPLHAPVFIGKEKEYLNECIDTTYVSSVGKFVDQFEEDLAKYTGSKYAVACVNGTNALHIGLLLGDVKKDDEVITQALTFVATANAITYSGAQPVFIDVDKDTMGLSPQALERFLMENAELRSDGYTYNKKTNNKIKACVPMHTFGMPARIDELAEICNHWNIFLIEDAAESLGSYRGNQHTGTFGKMGVFSFNGNKTITSGGGGALITNDIDLAQRAKHLTTQAKVPHQWKFEHDHIGYNYRMPNINAALACAQLETLNVILENKRELAQKYSAFFADLSINFIKEPENTRSNYWLNAVLFDTKEERERFLAFSNKNGIMTRPIWELMTTLPMFKNCQQDGLMNSKYLVDRVVNIPSSYRKNG